MSYLNQDISKVEPPVWNQIGGTIAQGSSKTFETNIQNNTTSITGPILVQIIDITNISKSKYEQIEKLTESNESTTDRLRNNKRPASKNKVVNLQEEPDNAFPRTSTSSTYKLVLQDTAGTSIYAISLEPLDNTITETAPLGAKLLLLNTIPVQHRVLFLKKHNIQTLGGTLPYEIPSLLSRLEASMPPAAGLRPDP